MSGIIPVLRPRLTPQAANHYISSARPPNGTGERSAVFEPGEVILLGVRGYYHDKHSDNKRGIYDDAVAIIGPEHFSTYNANTDPSVFRPRIAALNEGIWEYKPGTHGLSKPKAQQYQAFVQAVPVTVQRDGHGDDTGWFGINIHRGSNNGTSSLGCQTIPPAQWKAFRSTLMDQLKRVGQKTFLYVLTS